MTKAAVARHYAQAVFEIGEERGTVDRWLEDLRLIAEYFGNRRLAFVLNEPNIPFTRKELIVRDLLSGKIQPDALGLALLLVERDLVDSAPRIRDEYERRYNDYHHQDVAEVVTAMPLDADLRERVRADLERITGKRILLRERVDPTILGGAIARVGDTLLDGSVRHRLTLLRQQIERGEGFFGGPSDGETIPPDLDRGPGGGGAPSAPGTPGGAGGAGPAGGTSGGGPGATGPSPNGAGPTSSTRTGPRAQASAHLAPVGAATGQPRASHPDRRGKRGKGRRR
ncbi:MAG TPA: ATP synthase F1 subunit delta [Ktedonobacterales bacterium]